MELEKPPLEAVEVRLNGYASSPAALFVTEALTPNSSSERLSLKKLEDELRALYGRPKGDHHIKHSLNEDEVVAVMHPEYRSWHRGKISQILNLLTGIRYRILLVDYGNVVSVKQDLLRLLPTSMADFPPQAKLVKLHGILPCALNVDFASNSMRKEIIDAWTPASLKFIADVVKRYKRAFFVASEKGFEFDDENVKYGDVLVELDSKLFSLSNELCFKNFAIMSPEEFLKVERSLHVATDSGDVCVSVSMPHTTKSLSSLSLTQSPSGSASDSSKKTRYMQEYEAELKAKKKAKRGQKLISPTSEGSTVTVSSESDSSLITTDRSQDSSSFTSASSTNVAKAVTSPQLEFLNAVRRKASSSTEESNDAVKRATSVDLTKENVHQATSSDLPAKIGTSVLTSCMLDQKNSRIFPAGRPVFPQKLQKQHTHELKKSSQMHQSDKSHDVSSDSYEECNFSSASSTSKALERNNHNANSSGASICSEPEDSFVKTPRISPSYLSVLKLRSPPNKYGTLDQEGPDRKPAGNCPSSDKFSRLAASCDIPHSELSLREIMSRYILLHGGLPPKPWRDLDDSSLQNHILLKMKRTFGWRQPLSIQMYAWPAIMQRQNVVLVASRGHGKTMGYCVPLMDFMLCCEVPKGNGPLVLILCASCTDVQSVSRCCKQLLSKYEQRHVRVKSAYGLVLDHETAVDFVNGCEVLVTTPCCLIRLLGVQNIVTNLQRLCHLVFDQADILLLKYLKEVKFILSKMNAMLSERPKDGETVQVIAASEKWIPALREFTTHIPANPLLCISDAIESAVYGKPDVALHLVPRECKAVKIVDLLDGRNGALKVLTVCSSEEEMDHVDKFLQSAGHQILVAKPADSSTSLEMVINSWNTSTHGQHYILVCTDIVLPLLGIRDAMWLIHYSLPQNKSFFSGRFSSLGQNYHNIFEGNISPSNPKVHFLVDECHESEQIPFIVHFMQRVGEDISPDILMKSKNLRHEKERRKESAPLCLNLKMYGGCWDMLSCSDRHALIPEYDSAIDLPTSGEVKIRVLHTHSASHLSARLLEHTSLDGKTRSLPNSFLFVAMKMYEHFSAEENRMTVAKVEVGDVCAINTGSDLYQRVKILKKNEHNARVVEVQSLDEGTRLSVMVMSLYYLPESLKSLPPQAVDVFLCRLLPGDQDETWGEVATNCVKQWVMVTQNYDDDDGKAKFCRGKICLALRGAVWLDPLHVEKWLPSYKLYAVVRNIRTSLVQMQHAVDNPDHLTKLYELCGNNTSFILPPHAKASFCKKPAPQPKPKWAFLEEGYEKVLFCNAFSPKSMFVTRLKFEKLRQDLVSAIGADIEKKKVKAIPVLESGTICLARDTVDKIWHRGQVLSVNDKEVTVFFVDFGDTQTLPRQDVTSIPDWAITRLPFQAIECGLVGVQAPKEGWSSGAALKVYDYSDDGEKVLFVKPCVREAQADHTGGRYYSVLLSDGATVLNKIILAEGVAVPCEKELVHLEGGLDGIPTNTSESEEEMEQELEEELEDKELEVEEEDFAQLLREAVEKEKRKEEDNIDVVVADRAPERESEFVRVGDHCVNVSNITCEEIMDFYTFVKAQQNTPSSEVKTHSQPRLHVEQQHLPLANAPSLSTEQPMSQAPVLTHGTNPRLRMMPLLNTARSAPISWSQDLFHLWIKVLITGAVSPFLQWTNNRIQISADVGGKKYVSDLKLCGIIVPETLVLQVGGFEVSIKVQKAVLGIHWPRLLESRRKYGWLHAEHTNVESDYSDSQDGEVNISKAVRKLPLHKRRRRTKQNDGPTVPDAYLSDSNSGSDVMDDRCGYDSL